METIIKAGRGITILNLKELSKYTSLLFFLMWKDLKIRYKQTLLGVLWVIIQPTLSMILFSIIFGKIARIPSEGIPYPIFYFVGIIIWNYFSNTVVKVGNELIANRNLISKIYFPRIILPIASSLTGMVDYLITLLILFALMIFYGFTLSLTFLVIPFIVLLTGLLATGIGLCIAALNVKFRDLSVITPFLMQLGMFLTPIVYPTSFIPTGYAWIIKSNPMTSIVNFHRSAILGVGSIEVVPLLYPLVISIIILIVSLIMFNKMEKHFSDVM